MKFYIIFSCSLIAFIAVVALIKGLILSKHIFVCKECSKEFKPKWYQVMYEFHCGRLFRIRCPYCKIKSLNRIK